MPGYHVADLLVTHFVTNEQGRFAGEHIFVHSWVVFRVVSGACGGGKISGLLSNSPLIFDSALNMFCWSFTLAILGAVGGNAQGSDHNVILEGKSRAVELDSLRRIVIARTRLFLDIPPNLGPINIDVPPKWRLDCIIFQAFLSLHIVCE